MTTKTFKQLKEVDSIVGELYAKDKTLEKTKFGYAYKRFLDKNYIPTMEKFQEKILDIRIENALEDKTTKEVLIDKMNPRGYKFTKEGLKKCIAEERVAVEEFDKTEIEIIPFISSFVPELSDEDKEELTGLVL